MARRIWLVAGVGLLLLAGILALLQVAIARVEPLPIYLSLPDVTLTDQDRRTFSLSQTRGKVVMMSLIYTNCPDICPLITSWMKQIQGRAQPQAWQIRWNCLRLRSTQSALRPASQGNLVRSSR